ncbi:hypothetical protein GCM10027168_10420 [Streptomyces capparidis]
MTAHCDFRGMTQAFADEVALAARQPPGEWRWRHPAGACGREELVALVRR